MIWASLLVFGAVLLWPARRRPATVVRPAARRPRGRRDRVPELPLAVVIELVAAALTCGLPPAAALAAAVRAAAGRTARDLQPVVDALALGASSEGAWSRAGERYDVLAQTLVLADRTGASAATALRRAASDERSARRRTALVASRRLGVQLVLPLGLLTLPSFVLLGVVPVVLGLAEQVLSG